MGRTKGTKIKVEEQDKKTVFTPKLRDRRLLKPKKYEVYEKFNSKWSLAEKKKVLQAVKKYEIHEVERIQAEYLPHRTCPEINMFLQRMKMKSMACPVVSKTKMPIELWVDMAEDLCSGVTDWSTVVAEIFSKLGSEEVHDPKLTPEDPDWQLLYQYISCQLTGDEPPPLGQIESLILLDVLDSLGERLKSLDVQEQARLMERKFALLSTKIRCNNRPRAFRLGQRALQEDLADSKKAGAGDAAATEANKSSSETGTIPTENSETSEARQSTSAATTSNADKPTEDDEKIVNQIRKADMYTLNPFCIPVKYLKLKKSTRATAQPIAKSHQSTTERVNDGSRSSVPVAVTSAAAAAAAAVTPSTTTFASTDASNTRAAVTSAASAAATPRGVVNGSSSSVSAGSRTCSASDTSESHRSSALPPDVASSVASKRRRLSSSKRGFGNPSQRVTSVANTASSSSLSAACVSQSSTVLPSDVVVSSGHHVRLPAQQSTNSEAFKHSHAVMKKSSLVAAGSAQAMRNGVQECNTQPASRMPPLEPGQLLSPFEYQSACNILVGSQQQQTSLVIKVRPNSAIAAKKRLSQESQGSASNVDLSCSDVGTQSTVVTLSPLPAAAVASQLSPTGASDKVMIGKRIVPVPTVTLPVRTRDQSRNYSVVGENPLSERRPKPAPATSPSFDTSKTHVIRLARTSAAAADSRLAPSCTSSESVEPSTCIVVQSSVEPHTPVVAVRENSNHVQLMPLQQFSKAKLAAPLQNRRFAIIRRPSSGLAVTSRTAKDPVGETMTTVQSATANIQNGAVPSSAVANDRTNGVVDDSSAQI